MMNAGRFWRGQAQLSLDIHPNDLFGFELDDFQLEAINHLEEGKSVVVSAPTGAGKTVIAEYAVEQALRANKRCFYTTPLKALSNQKFYDFRQKYGEEKVGLLTGDVSVNRDASVVVMTTEVFRNMLYGTILGDVRRNLKDVSAVVLDECHYMNDAERGTVWEESIIYCPVDIQLVGLSATIANGEELTTWIDETHGPTELVFSDFRPVPLRFYYFGDRHLYPLLNPGGGVNTQLKSRFGKGRKMQRDPKRRVKVGNLTPNPGDVLAVLSSRNMLPAICFLFSRRGCEDAMQRARGIPLVNAEEEAELRRSIDSYIEANPNLANHPHLPYLYESMSVHHAGMLPSWKAMVEKLFQRGLLKVVFATETLAAGINMPARTTVISSLSKRGDEGHRELRASEFLQMSGRAGRRGMDEVGHVVVLHHPFESVEDAARLATAPADPLSSRFTPSYGMVLNLLQRHTLDEARDLIEHSFGQFLVNRELEPLELQKLQYEQELERLANPLCPDRPGDLPLYSRRLEAVRAKHKQMQLTMKGLKGNDPSVVHEALEPVRHEIKEMLQVAYEMPCHGCAVQKPCNKQTDRIKHLESRLKDLNKRIAKESARYWTTFQALANILRLEGYLDGNSPSALGQTAAGIRGTNELFLTEVALSNVFDNLQPAEVAAVLTAIVTEEGRSSEPIRVRVSPEVEMALEKVHHIGRKLWRTQRDFDVEIPVEYNPTLSGLTEMWCRGASWDNIRYSTSFDEGDVVRSLRRTLDLCRQFIRAPNAPEKLVEKCMAAEQLIARDEIKEEF
jgi:superfamily II RNA helicase